VSSPPSPRWFGPDVDALEPDPDLLPSLLLGLARYVDPASSPPVGTPRGEPSLDAMRHILLGSFNSRAASNDDRRSASGAAVGGVCQQRSRATSRDGRLGEVLAPTVGAPPKRRSRKFGPSSTSSPPLSPPSGSPSPALASTISRHQALKPLSGGGSLADRTLRRGRSRVVLQHRWSTASSTSS
jgi:hypothetical protein